MRRSRRITTRKKIGRMWNEMLILGMINGAFPAKCLPVVPIDVGGM